MSALAVPIVILFLAAGCSSAPGPASSSGNGPSAATGAGADAGSVAAASTVLKAVHLADPASLAALQGVRLTAAGTQAAADLLKAGASGDVLWAATYVYGSASGDPAPLKPIATDPNATATIRAMAAAGLVGGGDVAGFDPLIAALSGTDRMDGAEPAGAVWEFAADVLQRYTKQGFGPLLTATDAERITIAAEWKTWLDANRAKLHFDATTQLWAAA